MPAPRLPMLLALVGCSLASAAQAPGPIPSLRGQGFPVPPDTRPPSCRRTFDGVDLGGNATVSIIIPYHRESWEHFRPTMQSLLHFTPDNLVEEFILISDGNPPELTYEEELRSMSPKVVVLKNPEREGLIRAKMRAVDNARADVLVFLEAHCIANRQWLEPLLARLAESPRALVQPSLDVIPQDNFAGYRAGGPGHFRFEWNMNLVWTAPPEPQVGLPADAPVPSPATSGGIFAVRRDWWRHLGFYDPEMREWGGDHFEATMKVWRCGGHIDVHPCSRVGHLFRDPQHRPYDVHIPVVVHNYARLALVWLDEYLPTFYKLKPDAQRATVGDVTAQRELRERLGCKDMAWYLQNVDPEMEWEATRVCIPGARPENGGCRGKKAAGRSTVDQTMPPDEYKQRRLEILHRLQGREDRESHEL